MYRDVQRCTEMYRDVQRCTEMYRDVQRCTEMYSISAQHLCTLIKKAKLFCIDEELLNGLYIALRSPSHCEKQQY